ncbi:substrate-binding domain-containing protein [Lacrimispora sp. NSJ-141]|uniref:Substrate-binding domain-containing protein n=1 Tax=Lientehia hominis TaxID=2897778 RepID=A0AAP2W796_9FIRM|nr:substrate-binding domain-containing protein [Lientehia hominis]MCD2492178.1 substrate-binding domain-containing protein [Lientehia hominis]
MKKMISCVLFLCLMITLLAGCGSSPAGKSGKTETKASETAVKTTEAKTGAKDTTAAETEKGFETKELSELKVGISFYAYASASAIRQLDYLVYTFEGAGCTVSYAVCNNSVEQQIADVESLIEQKCDVIILDPCQSEGYDSALADCRAAGIPVFVMGNALNSDVYTAGEDYVTLLQSDMKLQGENAGNAVLRIVDEKLNGQTAYCVVVFGTPGMQSATDRLNGYNEVDFANDSIVTIGTQTAYNKAADAQSIVENYIMSSGGPETEKGVNVIVCMTHNCAIGAVAAIKNMGYTPNKDIYVVVVDGVKEDLQSILDDELYIAVESPCFYAEQQLDLIQRYFQGETLDSYYEIKTTVFDSSNAQEWFDNFSKFDELIGYEGQ